MAVERTRGFTAAGLVVVLLTAAGTAFGQQDVPSGSATALAPPPGDGEQEAVAEELERRIGLLAEEVERLRSGEPEIDLTDDQTRALGLAPSAATIYRQAPARTRSGRQDVPGAGGELAAAESAAPVAGEGAEAGPELIAERAGASEPESAPPPPPAAGEQETNIEELERRIELLAEEVERLRSGEPEVDLTDDQTRALGLAPSAAATYRGGTGVSIAGYGEMLYENYASSKTSQFDYLRAILYAGYRFNDRFLFNSEIEVEHANEIFVEFAYVDSPPRTSASAPACC